MQKTRLQSMLEAIENGQAYMTELGGDRESEKFMITFSPRFICISDSSAESVTEITNPSDARIIAAGIFAWSLKNSDDELAEMGRVAIEEIARQDLLPVQAKIDRYIRVDHGDGTAETIPVANRAEAQIEAKKFPDAVSIRYREVQPEALLTDKQLEP